MPGALLLLEEVDDATARWLAQRWTRFSLEPQESLFIEGDDAGAMYVVEHGLLRIERVALTGQRQLLTLAGPGDTVGELAVLEGGVHSASVFAMSQTSLLRLRREDVDVALTTFPDMSLTLARMLADRLRALTDQLVELAAGSAVTRAASRIVQLLPDDCGPGPVDVGVRISQSELAAWAGLSREGIVKALRVLRQEGVLQTSRQRIQVNDVSALRAHAGV